MLKLNHQLELKTKIKRIFGSKITKVIIYFRYVIIRYFRLLFRNYYLYNNVRLDVIDDDGITFFGYYGLIPECNNRVLYLKVYKPELRGSKSEKAQIMVKDLVTGYRTSLLYTRSWNWQQGAQLRWINFNCTFSYAFNDFNTDSGSYNTVIASIDGSVLKRLHRPFYTIFNNSLTLLSINYDRLTLLRPDYGYFNKETVDELDDSNDGIWVYSDINQNWELIIDFETLKNHRYVDSMENAIHKVNHLDVSPNDENLIFLHRWKGPKGRFTRLVTFNFSSKKMKILNGDFMTSHCTWLTNSEVLAFCMVENGNVGYYKFDIETGDYILFSNKLPQIDGHPSKSPDGRWLVIDTYPDISRFSSLFLFDLNLNKLILLGRFWQSLDFTGEIRVDLHPKWSLDSKRIYFESAHEGSRRLYYIEIIN